MNPVKASKNAKNFHAKIMVIGGGGGGLAAAVAAAESGVNDIIVLEARRVPGGNAVFPMGIFAAESRLQKALGIDASDDKLFKKALDYSHWKTNPRLVRALIDKSGDTVRWLEEKGVKFVGVFPISPDQVTPTFHLSERGKTGSAIVKALVKNCEDLGVRFFCQTKAKRLIMSNTGKVSGVLAETENKEVRIDAKSVIIATGGLAGNNQLLKTFLPTFDEKEIHHQGIRHRGDGLLMAIEAGAASEGMVSLEMEGPAFPWSTYLAAVSHRPNTVFVNKRGVRFTDESVSSTFPESANAIYRQPGKVSYTLFDEKIKKNIIKGGPWPLEEQILIPNSSYWTTRVDKDLQLQADKGRVKISGSWDEIAEWIGAVPEVLKSTIDEYNSCCDRRCDETFAKDQKYLLPLRTPPYYAIQCCLNLVATHGGIKVNQRLEVLDNEDNTIPGLYAAGVDIGGTDSGTYNVNLTGHSFGFTINSGRIAGESAAEYVLG